MEISNSSGRGGSGSVFFGESLRLPVRVYVLSLIGLGIPLTLYCLAQVLQAGNWNWAYLAGMAVLTSCFVIRIQLGTVAGTSLSITAVVIALVEGLTFNLRMKVTNFYRQLFNLAQVAVVAYLIGQLLELLLRRTDFFPEEQVARWIMMLAAGLTGGLLYFLFTSGFVAGAVALSSRQRLVPLWKQTLVWTPLTLTAAALGSTIYLYFN